MKTKVIEIRDEGTCISALAIRMEAANGVEDAFLRRCGYPPGGGGVVLMDLNNQQANSDPYGQRSGTMQIAHNFILDHWPALKEGEVVDVRVIQGHATKRAAPEIWNINQRAEA